ncbi:MAG: CheR family methyltransferase, partial [Myxococcota bacterium]
MMTRSTEPTSPSPTFYVGVGASAGGAEALLELFRALRPDLGCCFLIVTQESPDREGHLPALLRGATTMPVVGVLQPMPLEANTVYVVSPNHSLTVTASVVEATELDHAQKTDDLVDRLFMSLADSYGERAVAVVLSGTRSAGAVGLTQVHGSGGLCLVEVPHSDSRGDMPRVAIATGCVDHIERPAKVAELLATHMAPFTRHHDSLRRDQAIEAILHELSEAYGVEFKEAYKRGTLARRLHKRMATLGLTDYHAYLEHLCAEPAEMPMLQRDMLIGVTSFFRDPSVWQLLDQKILPASLSGRSSRSPVKLWCAGCASGEEAYSLGMLFLEHLEGMRQAPKLHVFGSDVAEEALMVARRGHYPGTIVDSVSADRLERWFVREDHGFRVKQELRRVVTFAAHDLLSDPPFSGLDLVSCRNVLIYLEPHAQDRILDLFHFALKPGGLLLLGQSGSVARRSNLFETVSKSENIYRAREVSLHDRRRQFSLFPGRTHLRTSSTAPTSPVRQPKSARTLEQFILSRHTLATVVVSDALEIQS